MAVNILPRTIHGNIQLPWVTLGLVMFASILYMTTGAAPEPLVYLTQTPFTEWYRVFTSHWVHSDNEHAILNISALLLLGIMFEPVIKKQMLSVLLLSSVIVALWTAILVPELRAYCGLSGILNALFVYGSLRLWLHYQNRLYLLFILLALTKTLVELYSQQAIFSHTSWPAVPEAHLVGMLSGAIHYSLFYQKPDKSTRHVH